MFSVKFLIANLPLGSDLQWVLHWLTTAPTQKLMGLRVPQQETVRWDKLQEKKQI